MSLYFTKFTLYHRKPLWACHRSVHTAWRLCFWWCFSLIAQFWSHQTMEPSSNWLQFLPKTLRQTEAKMSCDIFFIVSFLWNSPIKLWLFHCLCSSCCLYSRSNLTKACPLCTWFSLRRQDTVRHQHVLVCYADTNNLIFLPGIVVLLLNVFSPVIGTWCIEVMLSLICKLSGGVALDQAKVSISQDLLLHL